MATKKDNKKTIYTLLLVGGVGYLIYKKMIDKKKKEAEEQKVLATEDAWDESEYTEEKGKSYISPELFENRDPIFMDHVRHLQQKLNNILGKMVKEGDKFPYYPLEVDGLLGFRTALAIVRVFGKGVTPINNQEQIIKLYTNYE
jgi:hypothetical protein